MHSTLKTILLSFLGLTLLLVSYSLRIAPGNTEANQETKAQLNRPILKLPVSEATAKTSFKFLQKNDAIYPPEIFASSALVFNLTEDKNLLQKNSDFKRPIASITKLISSVVVLDNAFFSEEVIISPRAVNTEGDTGQLRSGEVLSVEALLNAALLTSSNDAIVALAEHISDNGKEFVFLMNKKAKELGILNSNFTDPAGLEDKKSFSTAEDLLTFVKELRSNIRYEDIWQILQKKETQFYSKDDGYSHTFVNNNELISQIQGVIGGKTGYTELAGGSLVMVVEGPDGQSEVVYIILGSTDRFGDVRSLINWVSSAYIWER